MENQFIAGKYAKGKIKENRNLLIKLCKLRDLLITNTILKQKTSQQTTRTLPLPPKLPCKNPYQNQIDHINPYRNQIYHILVKESSKLKFFFSIMMMFTRNKTIKIYATVPRRQYTVLSGKNQNLKC